MIAPIIIILSLLVVLFAWNQGYAEFLAVISFIIILMPDNVLIFRDFIFNLKLHRIIFVVFILLYLRNRHVFRSNDTNRPGNIPLLYLLALSAMSLVISTLFSINFANSLKSIISTTLEFYVLYVLFYVMIKNMEDIRKISFAIYLAIFVSSIMGIVQYYSGWNPSIYLPAMETRAGVGFNLERGLRVWGNFPHPILMGGAISIGLPLGFSLMWNAKNIIRKIYYMLSIFMMFICLYHTLSRGSIIVSFIGLTILLFLSNNSIKKYIGFFVVLILLAFIIRPGVYGSLLRIWNESFGTETTIGTSTFYRVRLIHLAYDTLMLDTQRLFIGYGPKTFWDLELKGDFLGMDYNFISCDSSWIEFLLSGGIIYFIIMALIFINIFKYGINYLRHSKKNGDNAEFKSIFVSIISYFLLMFFVAIYGWSQHGYLLWILVAMLFSYKKFDYSPKKV